MLPPCDATQGFFPTRINRPGFLATLVITQGSLSILVTVGFRILRLLYSESDAFRCTVHKVCGGAGAHSAVAFDGTTLQHSAI